MLVRRRGGVGGGEGCVRCEMERSEGWGGGRGRLGVGIVSYM